MTVSGSENHPGIGLTHTSLTDKPSHTEANRGAVGTWCHILQAIDICGMEGPVQIVPYVDQTMTLHASTNGQ